MEYSILLLDDNEELLELIKINFESIDHFKILPFSDPVQALRRIELYGLPHLIVTDFHLPGINGIDFLTEVSRHYSNVEAILFTAATNALPENCRYPVIHKDADSYDRLIAMAKSILRLPA
jgi:CheY-like chemotaxis protein